mgnify:CR=1 FL=1
MGLVIFSLYSCSYYNAIATQRMYPKRCVRCIFFYFHLKTYTRKSHLRILDAGVIDGL